jgi:hypothetical protein
MLHQLRVMPVGVRVFLVYGFLVLALVALTLPLVIAQAVEAPISVAGLIDMLLLAYLIFTLTLVLQRKQAGYPLAIGLGTLALPMAPILLLSPAGVPGALIALMVAVVVLGTLRLRSSKSWFVEP